MRELGVVSSVLVMKLVMDFVGRMGLLLLQKMVVLLLMGMKAQKVKDMVLDIHKRENSSCDVISCS